MVTPENGPLIGIRIECDATVTRANPAPEIEGVSDDERGSNDNG